MAIVNVSVFVSHKEGRQRRVECPETRQPYHVHSFVLAETDKAIHGSRCLDAEKCLPLRFRSLTSCYEVARPLLTLPCLCLVAFILVVVSNVKLRTKHTSAYGIKVTDL